MNHSYSPNCYESFDREEVLHKSHRQLAIGNETRRKRKLPALTTHRPSPADVVESLRKELSGRFELLPAHVELLNPSPRPASSAPSRERFHHQSLKDEVKRLFPQRTRGEQLEALRQILQSRTPDPIRTILTPVTEDVRETMGQAASLLRAKLQKRTEAEWLRLVEEIEDEELREAVGKKVYWDFFIAGKRRWKGLDYLISEDGDGRVVKYTAKNWAWRVRDIRIALWRMGYPVSNIVNNYPSTQEVRGEDKTIVFREVTPSAVPESGDLADDEIPDLVVGVASHDEEAGDARDRVVLGPQGTARQQLGDVVTVQPEPLNHPDGIGFGLDRANFECHHAEILMRRSSSYNPLRLAAK